MFFSLEYLITMEKRLTSNNVQLSPSLVLLDWLSFFPIFFNFADRIHELISKSLSLFQSQPNTKTSSQSNSESELTQQKVCLNGDGRLSREDVKTVMERLELFCSQEGEEELGEYFGPDEFTAMFDESEPSLEELKETFNVFDANRDGFIDAEELQRVLGLLGSNKGESLHDCKKMIAKFDPNKDGKIDFNEFVKFMEIALC